MNRREGCVLAVLANCSQDFWKIRDKTTVNVQATNYPFNGTRFLILHCDLLLLNFSKKFGFSNAFGHSSVFLSQIKEETILLQLKALMFSISLEPQ